MEHGSVSILYCHLVILCSFLGLSYFTSFKSKDDQAESWLGQSFFFAAEMAARGYSSVSLHSEKKIFLTL